MKTRQRTSKNDWTGHVFGEWRIVAEEPDTRNRWRAEHVGDPRRTLGGTVEQFAALAKGRRLDTRA